MTDLQTLMPGYERYKDSGVEWLGEIPAHWNKNRFKFIASTSKGKLPKHIVSNIYEMAPVYMTMDFLRGGNANQWVIDFNAEIIESNEIILLWDGSNSGEFLKSRKGVISSTVALVKFHGISKEFAWFFSNIIERKLRTVTVGMGIPHVNGQELQNSIVLSPPIEEQIAIAIFLNCKTAIIDQAIAIKEKQINLLKECKQVLIQNAVTKGLDPDAPVQDSGVEWIGEIPAHWGVKRLKYILEERKERTKTGKEPLLMVSQIYGLVVRSEYHEKSEVAQNNINNEIPRRKRTGYRQRIKPILTSQAMGY